MYHIKPMTAKYADIISGWVYPGEYAIYSFGHDEEGKGELLNGTYLLVRTQTGHDLCQFLEK